MKFLYNKGFLQNFAAIFIAVLLIVGASIINLSRPEPVYATSCSIYDGDQTSCSSTVGCSWNDSCSVFNGDQSSCESGGCSYPANLGDCTAFVDYTSCSSVPGCAPDNGDCNNFSDGGGDGSACATQPGCTYDAGGSGLCSGSYFAGCSGSYDNGICSGVLSSGLCTGDFDETAPTISIVTPVPTPTNSATPSYTFTSDEEGTIGYSGCDGTPTGNISSGSNIITINAIAEGTYSNCFIWVTDAGNNRSADLPIPEFVIDLTAPNYTTTPNLVTLSDSGSSNTDNITNDDTPSFLITCDENGSTITLLEGVDILGTDTCNGGSATITTSSLSHGTHYISATQTDIAGNVSAESSALGVTIDSALPTISEVTAVPNYTNDTTPNYTFTVDEAGTITYGGSCSSVTTSASSGSNTITFATLAVGTYSNCTITVTDTAGNVSDELAVASFTIDTTAPTISSVSSDKAAGSYTVGEVIDIDVTFSEDVLSTGDVTVTLETGTTDRTCTFTVSNATTGTCNYTVQAGDTSSDLTINSISGTITDTATNAMSNFVPVTNLAANEALVIDTTAPTVSLTAPTDGATVSGASVTVSANASDTNLVGVQFKRATNTNIGSEDTTSAYSVTWDVTGLSDGSQTLIAVARDTAGNYATSTSRTVTVSNDSTAPTISSVTSNKADGSYTVGEVIDIDVLFSEAVTSTGNVTVTLETGTTDRTCTFTASNTTTGTCNYTVQSGDTSSDLTVSSISGTIADAASNAMSVFTPVSNLAATSALVVDTTSPTISESGAIATATDTTPDYTFTTTEAGTISYGGSCSSVTTSASSGSNTITLTALAVGTYSNCTIIVTDVAGNASNTLAVTSFTISSGTSDPEPEVEEDNTHNISGSSPSRLTTVVTTTPLTNTPSNPPCSSGERFNTNTGLPCGNSTPPEVPGCAFGFNFSILTGKSCNTSPVSPQTPNTPNTPSTFKFLKDIPFGTIRSDDARQLQIFLNTHNFPVALTGVGSRGYETRYFGPATRTALAKFQAFAGITPALGFFGPVTRNYINNL